MFFYTTIPTNANCSYGTRHKRDSKIQRAKGYSKFFSKCTSIKNSLEGIHFPLKKIEWQIDVRFIYKRLSMGWIIAFFVDDV